MAHYKQLDGLRFIAVLGVIISHWIAWASHNIILSTFPFRHGVLLFFVLSGFLITEILYKQKKRIELGETRFGRELKNFYARRTLRIFPIYYLLIFTLYFLNYDVTRQIFPSIATYTFNIHLAEINEPIGRFMYFWSLAVEEQFYIVWPFFILLLPTRHLLKFILIVIILSILSQALYIIYLPGWWCAANYQTYNIMYSLGLGALLACLKNKHTNIFTNISQSVIYTPFFFCLFVASFYLITYKNPYVIIVVLYDNFLFCVFAFFLIARAVGPGFKGFGKLLLENKVISHLGKLSYAIYLLHVCLPDLAMQIHIFSSKELNWLFWFLFTVGIAQISFWLIEKPFNTLKKHFV